MPHYSVVWVGHRQANYQESGRHTITVEESIVRGELGVAEDIPISLEHIMQWAASPLRVVEIRYAASNLTPTYSEVIVDRPLVAVVPRENEFEMGLNPNPWRIAGHTPSPYRHRSGCECNVCSTNLAWTKSPQKAGATPEGMRVLTVHELRLVRDDEPTEQDR